MAFINTSELIGDEAYVDSILSGTITELCDNYVTKIGTYALIYSTYLAIVDVPNCTLIDGYAFYGNSALRTLILRYNAVVSLTNNNALSSTPIKSGTGYIYVPRVLIDSYKAATNWSTYANQFRALEDYTVDGTVTGDLDESKI